MFYAVEMIIDPQNLFLMKYEMAYRFSTYIVALHQSAPETFHFFDDIILTAEEKVVRHSSYGNFI